MEGKKQIQGRNWLCTLNNPEVTLEEIHKQSKATYTCGQLERGENGTPHLQFFQNFKSPIKLTMYKKVNTKIHAEVIKINNGAHNYCMKEDTRIEGPWEYGEKPIQRNNKEDWEKVRELAKEGKLDEIPADIFVRHYSNLKKIQKDYIKITDATDLRGSWIYGPAGVGKSRQARVDFPDAYPKLCNKWWDGYQNQKNVIMDDIGLDHKCLGQQLKIWSDRYGCILETKGGAMASEYENFVVTSQYTIDEIWIGDQSTIDALKRRFKVKHIPFNIWGNNK